jgi:hypothetical protein
MLTKHFRSELFDDSELSSAKLSCLVFKTNLKFCQTTYMCPVVKCCQINNFVFEQPKAKKKYTSAYGYIRETNRVGRDQSANSFYWFIDLYAWKDNSCLHFFNKAWITLIKWHRFTGKNRVGRVTVNRHIFLA